MQNKLNPNSKKSLFEKWSWRSGTDRQTLPTVDKFGYQYQIVFVILIMILIVIMRMMMITMVTIIIFIVVLHVSCRWMVLYTEWRK